MNRPRGLSLLKDTFGPEHQYKRKITAELEPLRSVFTICLENTIQQPGEALYVYIVRNNDITLEDLFLGGRRKACKDLIDELDWDNPIIRNIAVVFGNSTIKEDLVILINADLKIEKQIKTPYIHTTMSFQSQQVDVVIGLWKEFCKISREGF
jgi:hypothetical protein